MNSSPLSSDLLTSGDRGSQLAEFFSGYFRLSMLLFVSSLAICSIFYGHAFAESGPAGTVASQDDAAELAKKLQNPIADLISLPVQNNWDFGIGPKDAYRYTANIQPVIPISISEDWNVITRTILPVIHAQSPVDGLDSTTGLGDMVQSFFFSPKAPTSNGWVWGAGPVFYWPTSSDRLLGSGKTGAGPTAVFLKQDSGWTYGLLANQIWSFAGPDTSADINATFAQPFFSYTTKSFTSLGLTSESTYNWEAREWTVPLNVNLSQLLKVGGIPMQFLIGPRFYLDRPDGGPNFGLRFMVTFLLPK